MMISPFEQFKADSIRPPQTVPVSPEPVAAVITRDQALSEITAIMANVMTMGRNDEEYSLFQHIIDQVTIGAITPDDGLAMARAIPEHKQDYN